MPVRRKFGAGRGLVLIAVEIALVYLQQNVAGDPGIVGVDDAVERFGDLGAPATVVRRARRDHPGTRVRYHPQGR